MAQGPASRPDVQTNGSAGTKDETRKGTRNKPANDGRQEKEEQSTAKKTKKKRTRPEELGKKEWGILSTYRDWWVLCDSVLCQGLFVDA